MADFERTIDTAAEAFAALAPIDDEPRKRQDDAEADDVDDEPLDNSDDDDDDAGEAEGEPSAEDDEPDVEAATPPIDPPVSWDAEAKEVFAKLPPEAQRIVADRESQRDKAIQVKATEAAQHRKAAEAVTEQYTQLHRQFAEQLDTYAKAFEPEEPDYSLITTDPQAFAQQMAEYKQMLAQRDTLAQQSAQARQHAETVEHQQAAQKQAAEEAYLAEAIPGWADVGKRTELLGHVVETARELGYTDELIRQAQSTDILAVHRASEWKAKADRWDALQKSKMETVRTAKTLPKVSTPGTAQPKGSARALGLQDSMGRLRKSGSVDDAAAAFRNLR